MKIDRVVINKDGESIPLPKAVERGIRPDVAFIRREDGWTLGAPAELEDVAHSLWAGHWVARAEWDGSKWNRKEM